MLFGMHSCSGSPTCLNSNVKIYSYMYLTTILIKNLSLLIHTPIFGRGTTSRCWNAKTKTVLELGCKKISKNSNSTYSLHILAISSWPTVHTWYTCDSQMAHKWPKHGSEMTHTWLTHCSHGPDKTCYVFVVSFFSCFLKIWFIHTMQMFFMSCIEFLNC